MRKYLLFLSFLISITSTCQANAQEFGVQWGGFIRTDLYWDSRVNEGARDNILMLYPKNIELNADGKDINDKPSFQWASLATRANMKITTPDVLGATTSGFIEAEFFGQADAQTNVLRLRHAYVNMDWSADKLLIGQTWNPMFVPETAAQSLALSAGAPVTALVRNPQINYQHRFGNSIYAGVTALVQRDFTSVGPNGASTEYMRYAMIPTINLQLKYKNTDGSLVGGISGEIKTLRPYTEFNGYSIEKNITTFAVNGFIGFLLKKINFRANVWYGGNMADFFMLGGYAISDYENGLPSKYTPFNNVAAMLDISYSLHKNAKIGIYAGVNQNLGTADEISVNNPYWARGKNIDMLLRIAPRFTYQVNKLQFGCEAEYTGANYGKTPEFANDAQIMWQGKWNETTAVNNIRLLFISTLFF